jgi:tetratricopeptide (TPR) repeat protein
LRAPAAPPPAAPLDSNCRPTNCPTAATSPTGARYNKAGLFNGPSSEQVTSDNTPDVAVAEAHYLTLLNTNLPDPQRRTVLLELAAMYQRYNVKPKVAATYERYAEVFPQDPIVPEIYMRLGFLYREIGAFKMALSKFYSVLNSSLAINRDQMDTYRRLSLKAQVEIADTYYVMGDYEQAAKFFLRLKRLELSENERALVDFKYAYTQFLLESYPSSITNLQAFLEAHNGHPLEAEARFLLANACKRLGQTDRALSETLTLLQKQQQSGDPLLWAYWQKRTGNQLANEFYEQGDFAKALHIYQAMLHLSDDPEWEWPVAYQIGLCFERLRMVPKSIEAYQYILGEADVYSKEGRSLPAILQDLRQQASWRLEHLQWVGRTEAEVNRVVGEG